MNSSVLFSSICALLLLAGCVEPAPGINLPSPPLQDWTEQSPEQITAPLQTEGYAIPEISKPFSERFLEGEEKEIYAHHIKLLEVDQEALILFGTQQLILYQGETITADGIEITLSRIERDAVTELRKSFVDVSARVFGVGGIHDVLAVGENRTVKIGNKTYSIEVTFIGLDTMDRDTVLFTVNGETRSVNRRDDSLVGGLYLFVHEIYRVRPDATVTYDRATLTFRKV